MHAVLPLVIRVAGHVDALLSRMLPAEFGIHSQPVLQREDAEHRRTVEMAGDDLLSQMGRQMLRSPPLLLEHRDVEALCTFRTLLPPEPQRRHVVG